MAGPAPDGYVSHISTDPLAVRYAKTLVDLANGARQGKGQVVEPVASIYDDAAQQIGPGESTGYGHLEIADFWYSVFGALQVGKFDIEHLAIQRDLENTGRSDRISLRFRAKTVHSPHPDCITRYGPGSNRSVEVLGIVHAEFVQGRVVREWILIDDVAIWMQILTLNT